MISSPSTLLFSLPSATGVVKKPLLDICFLVIRYRRFHIIQVLVTDSSVLDVLYKTVEALSVDIDHR